MLLPIIAVLWFQSYWIMSTYKINEENFQQDIKGALLKAIDIDIINKTRDNLPSIDSMMTYESKHQDINLPDGLGFREFMNLLESDDSISGEKIIIEFSGEVNELAGLKIFGLDSLLPSDNTNHDTTIYISGSNESVSEFTWKDLILKALSDIIEHQTNLHQIDSLYHIQLKEKGLDIEFEMALYNNLGFIESTSGDSSKFINPDIKTSIKKTGNDHSEIRVIIPQMKKFLLLNMWLTFLSSLVLVLLVIGAFIYMLTIIMRQKKLSDMKNDFISNMTHEFKTPVATVSAAIESMQNFGVLDDKVKTENYLNISIKELQRLNSMIENVMDISAYERQKVSFNKEVLSLADLCKDVVERFKIQKDEGINIFIEARGDILVFADRMHLQSLINNLLDNAVKYCDTKPEIQIRCLIKNSKAELRIQDNGIGISKEHQNYIFDKFYRAPNDSIHNIKGFGLGLSYVHHIVDKHDGQISVISKLGAGSEFIIQLPLYDESN